MSPLCRRSSVGRLQTPFPQGGAAGELVSGLRQRRRPGASCGPTPSRRDRARSTNPRGNNRRDGPGRGRRLRPTIGGRQRRRAGTGPGVPIGPFLTGSAVDPATDLATGSGGGMSVPPSTRKGPHAAVSLRIDRREPLIEGTPQSSMPRKAGDGIDRFARNGNGGSRIGDVVRAYAFTFSAIAVNCSRAVCRSSAISWAKMSGGGRSSESSRLLSRSQKMSRFTLSRFIRSS